MYKIHLWLPYDCPSTWNKLKQFGDFEVYIADPCRINLEKDSRFKYQSWVKNNFFGRLRIKHLVDIIYFIIRLNGLKAFN
jgi:hypothetical protein